VRPSRLPAGRFRSFGGCVARIVPGIAYVRAGSTVQVVATGPADEVVVALVPPDLVVTVAAVQSPVPGATLVPSENDVGLFPCQDGVSARTAVDEVLASTRA
jgi:hypothetical protein